MYRTYFTMQHIGMATKTKLKGIDPSFKILAVSSAVTSELFQVDDSSLVNLN